MKRIEPVRPPRHPPIEAAVVDHLRSIVGESGVVHDAGALERFGHDETENLVFPPQLAVLPGSTAEVSAVLALACREGIPVTPRGAGTGLSGGALPVAGGLVLSLERMNRIREISTRDLCAVVEAGVVLADFQAAVEELGLFYPPDPASRESCQLGGNLAEDSAGPRSCKYGSTRRWVLGLEAVLADGTVISTGSRNRKDVTGFNLTQLLVGSEGTLAVLTAATLRLIAKPKATLTVALPFPDLESAALAVEAVFREGFDPTSCELLEQAALAAVGKVLPLPRELATMAALILLELDGERSDDLLEAAAGLADLGARLGGGEALVAVDAADQRRLWAIRRKVGEAVKHRSLYKEADTVVPRHRLAELVRAARAAARAHGIECVAYGHAGDGNLHVNLLRGDLPAELWAERRDAAEAELFRATLEFGGAITGEHGIGWTQRRYLVEALGADQVDLLRRIKQAWDPRGILNPGKVLP